MNNEIIFLICFIFYAFLMTFFVIKFVNKKLFYLKKQDNEFYENYKSFTRSDYKNWSWFEMIFCGIFLFIPRILLILIFIPIGLIIVYILSFLFCIKDFNEEQPAVFKWITNRIINFGCRLILFCFGFYWIKTDYKNTVDGSSKEEVNNCNVIISNHVSFMDIIYLLTQYDIPGIIAKSSVKNIPFVGRFAQIIQCIFINRESKESKIDAFKSLKNRIDLLNKGKKFNKLFIFPEGTTNNGENILDFKKGAFVLNEKIKIMIFDYRGTKYNPAFNLVDLGTCLILNLLQFYSCLKVTTLDIIIDPKRINNNTENWKILSNQARELISIYGNYELSNDTYTQKYKAEVLLNESLAEDN